MSEDVEDQGGLLMLLKLQVMGVFHPYYVPLALSEIVVKLSCMFK